VSRVYIYNILSHCPNFCRSSSTRTRALTRTYMYIVAWWQAGEHRWQCTLTIHAHNNHMHFFFFFLCKVPPTRLDNGVKVVVLVLSCFSDDEHNLCMISSLLCFIGSSVEVELCSFIFLGLILAVAAAAA